MLDPNIGTIKAYYKTWDYTADGALMASFVEVESQQCTMAELGLDPEDAPEAVAEEFEPTQEDIDEVQAALDELTAGTDTEFELPPLPTDGGRRLAMWDEEPFRFYQAVDVSSRKSLSEYQLSLQCIKQDAETKANEQVSLMGNSEHLQGKQLVFLFEACSGSVDCIAPSNTK